MATADYATMNGQGIRTATGWVWSCDHCPVVTHLGAWSDVEGFDVRRWLDSVDRTHYCQHKD